MRRELFGVMFVVVCLLLASCGGVPDTKLESQAGFSISLSKSTVYASYTTSPYGTDSTTASISKPSNCAFDDVSVRINSVTGLSYTGYTPDKGLGFTTTSGNYVTLYVRKSGIGTSTNGTKTTQVVARFTQASRPCYNMTVTAPLTVVIQGQ